MESSFSNKEQIVKRKWIKNMSRMSAMLAFVSVFVATAALDAAPQCNCGRKHSCLKCRGGSECVECPSCQGEFVAPPMEYCELEVKEGTEERTCFEIDQKTICIPKVIPPWRQGCCEPVCAEARSVKILKTKKYECPICEYKWSVKKPELPQIITPEAAGGSGAAPAGADSQSSPSDSLTPVPVTKASSGGGIPTPPPPPPVIVRPADYFAK
jgi:hypothetical protein